MRHYNTYLKRFTAPKVSKTGIKIPTNLKGTWVQYVAEVFRNMSLGGFIHFTYIGRHPVELVASDLNTVVHIVSSFITALANLSYFNLDTMRNFSKEIKIPPENYLELVKEVSYKDYHIQKEIEGELVPIYTEFGFCYAHNSQIAKMIQRNITEQAGVTDLIRNDAPIAGSYLSLGNDRSVIDVNTSFEAVRDLNINRRKCRFYDESNLKISRLYSMSLCHTQCRIDLAVEKCGCAPFFYEGILEAGYKICNVTKMLCLTNITEELISILGTNHTRTCNCYPTCENSVYMFSRDPTLDANPGEPTGVNYKINDFPKYRSKSDVLFTFSDMLVGFGGIAGLFLGFSVLSMVEIIYYITLRPFFYMREMNQLRKENNNRRRIMSFY